MTEFRTQLPQTLVVQLGARRQYAMAHALENAGMLAALYTDICGNVGLGKLLTAARIFGSARIGKLRDRNPPPAVAAKTTTFPIWALNMQRALRILDPDRRILAIDAAHRRAAEMMIARGFDGADQLLVQLMEARGLLTAAKRQGLTTVTDVNVALSAERIVSEERRKYPGWEADDCFWGDDLLTKVRGHRVIDESLEQTDIFLCPSSFVQDDLIENFGVARKKTRLLPYACNPRWFDIAPRPEKGRIFFAGEPSLRKGVHILARAAEILRARGHRYQFRVAGNATETIRSKAETRSLTFLGRQSYQNMRIEYANADLFAFPSLVEGAAGVTFEAMAAGLPLVTTKAAGSVVRHGTDGLIVPESHAEALADAIERVVEDREYRNSLANGARERAAEFVLNNFDARLGQALRASASEPVNNQ